jgi:hypothetical protein
MQSIYVAIWYRNDYCRRVTDNIERDLASPPSDNMMEFASGPLALWSRIKGRRIAIELVSIFLSSCVAFASGLPPQQNQQPAGIPSPESGASSDRVESIVSKLNANLDPRQWQDNEIRVVVKFDQVSGVLTSSSFNNGSLSNQFSAPLAQLDSNRFLVFLNTQINRVQISLSCVNGSSCGASLSMPPTGDGVTHLYSAVIIAGIDPHKQEVVVATIRQLFQAVSSGSGHSAAASAQNPMPQASVTPEASLMTVPTNYTPQYSTINASTNFHTISGDDVIWLLNHPQNFRVEEPSKDEKQTLFFGKWLKFNEEGLQNCNARQYGYVTMNGCATLMQYLGKGAADDRMLFEVLFVACSTASDVSGGFRACGDLGMQFTKIDNLPAAKAVLGSAPGCHTSDNGGSKFNGCFFALSSSPIAPHLDPELVNKLFTKAELLELAAWGCQQENDMYSCGYASMPFNEDLEVQKETSSSDAFDSALARQSVAQAQRQAESDAKLNAIVGAIQSVGGGRGATSTAGAARQQSAQQAPVATQENTTTAQQAQQAPDVRDMTQCVKILSVNFGVGLAGNNLTAIKVVFTNTCNQTIRATTSALESGMSCVKGGETTMLAPGSSYTFLATTDRNWYQVQADDGVDCYSSGRPSCGFQIPHSCASVSP